MFYFIQDYKYEDQHQINIKIFFIKKIILNKYIYLLLININLWLFE